MERGSVGWNRWLAEFGDERCKRCFGGGNDWLAAVKPLRNLRIESHALLSRAAMNVVQYVDSRCHCAIQWQAARDRHPGYCNRGCMGTMIDSRHKSRFEQGALPGSWQLAPQHKPDHLGKADSAD
jgi:hypothetical protein